MPNSLQSLEKASIAEIKLLKAAQEMVEFSFVAVCGFYGWNEAERQYTAAKRRLKRAIKQMKASYKS